MMTTHSTMIIGTSVVTTAVMISPSVPRANGIAVCSVRSPVRSECEAQKYIATLAIRKGSEFSSPTCMMLRLNVLMICGCQSDSALVTEVPPI